MDVVLLSRIQFAFTVAFHYIFPPLSIGLGVLLVIMEGMYLKTKNPLYHQMTRFWVKIFALIFAVGVATGIVMEFQFGTNWSKYSRFVGDVFGSPLALEALFAFFLESSFLAILVFGWNKVSPKMHFISTIMVTLGAHLSAVWILVANSWQQTPAGSRVVGEGDAARAEVYDFMQVVFNPSTFDRISHVYAAAWMTGACLVLSISAYYILTKKHTDFAKQSLKIALVVLAVGSILQLGTGHTSAITVAKYQPAKLAAFEGIYKTEPAPLYLFGWVNDEKQEVQFGIAIPKMLSMLVHMDPDKPVTGLNEFAPEDRPPVNVVFQVYHLMIAIGMTLIGVGALGMFLWWRGKLFESKLFMVLLLPIFLLPQIGNQVGWAAAEIGRQPWIVYGQLRTSDAVSKVVSAGEILFSLIMFGGIYLLMFVLFVSLMRRKIRQGPSEQDLLVGGQ